MVPLISTAQDARTAVKYSKFPPMGLRGFGSPLYVTITLVLCCPHLNQVFHSPMGAFGISSAVEYLEQANDSLLTIVQIETKEGLENV